MSVILQKARALLGRGITPVTLCAVMLGLLGLLAVFNASYHLPSGHRYVVRQGIWLALGTVVLVLSAGIPARVYRRIAPWLILPGYAALAGVLVWGIRIRRMQGWYSFPGFLVQPSEIVKPLFVISLALLAVVTAARRESFVKGYLLWLGVLCVWLIPLVLQPDFGMVLVYAAAFLAMSAVAGVPGRHLAVAVASALPLVLLAWRNVPYLRVRVFGFLSPQEFAETSGWHLLQFRRTLASGGLFGRGWGDCVWARTHLPLGHTDSMFATVGEALGFVGVFPLVVLLLAWCSYVCRRARDLDDSFAALVAVGLMSMVAGQALIHLSVNLGLMPITGLTLPLFSYGGSSMIATMLCVGASESLLQQKL
ncbi:MAG: FtsW/RodA/SpoVE family cell cycle protein [Verrucomicrobiota bacterium]